MLLVRWNSAVPVERATHTQNYYYFRSFFFFFLVLWCKANPNTKKAAKAQATGDEARRKKREEERKREKKTHTEKSNNIRSELKALMRARFHRSLMPQRCCFDWIPNFSHWLQGESTLAHAHTHTHSPIADIEVNTYGKNLTMCASARFHIRKTAGDT